MYFAENIRFLQAKHVAARAAVIRKGRYTFFKLAALTSLAVLTSSGAWAAGKISRDLNGFQPAAKVDVIVQYATAPTDSDQADLTNHGGNARAAFRNINGILATIPAAALNALAANPNVKYMSPDRKLAGALEFAEPTVNANIALQY